MAYVSPVDHRYIEDAAHREEGGTPAILESIRAGMVFQLKQAVGEEEIYMREQDFVNRALEHWSKNPNIRILGNTTAPRLSIMSFMVRHGERYLHHDFVVALLNDLFGIQARGGCSCAGPYGHRLLGIDIDTSHRFDSVIEEGCEILKPGWTRINFNYFISPTVFEYIVEAIDFIGTDGWRFLPDYYFDPAVGCWHHKSVGIPETTGLVDLLYDNGFLEYVSRRRSAPETDLASYLDIARDLARSRPVDDNIEQKALAPKQENLRWFALPNDDPDAKTAIQVAF